MGVRTRAGVGAADTGRRRVPERAGSGVSALSRGGSAATVQQMRRGGSGTAPPVLKRPAAGSCGSMESMRSSASSLTQAELSETAEPTPYVVDAVRDAQRLKSEIDTLRKENETLRDELGQVDDRLLDLLSCHLRNVNHLSV